MRDLLKAAEPLERKVREKFFPGHSDAAYFVLDKRERRIRGYEGKQGGSAIEHLGYNGKELLDSRFAIILSMYDWCDFITGIIKYVPPEFNGFYMNAGIRLNEQKLWKNYALSSKPVLADGDLLGYIVAIGEENRQWNTNTGAKKISLANGKELDEFLGRVEKISSGKKPYMVDIQGIDSQMIGRQTDRSNGVLRKALENPKITFLGLHSACPQVYTSIREMAILASRSTSDLGLLPLSETILTSGRESHKGPDGRDIPHSQ